MAMACDTFTTVEQNIASIANHIDTVRRQEAYGVASAEESLQVFAALPAPGAILLGNRTAWQILGLEPGSSSLQIERAHRRLAADLHPDRGGDSAAMADLNAARDAALKEVQP